jgi:hypothetical protein
MAKKRTKEKKPVPQEQVDACLAEAIAQGDIVNFRFLFVPDSPLRQSSTETLDMEKYAYLRPNDASDKHYQEALQTISMVMMHDFVNTQLEKTGPTQLPWELVMMLADNAVRLGKYSAAAQAYELLRVRRRMQDLFFTEADAALDNGDMPRAVQGYRIAAGLEYDYAAFPEPLPLVPDYQSRALVLHAEYPRRPEDSLALQPETNHVNTALSYLLHSAEAATRLETRPLETRRAFLVELVKQCDPNWDAFTEQYREACTKMKALAERLDQAAKRAPDAEPTWEEEMGDDADADKPEAIAGILLGYGLEDGEWWQYMKEMAFLHPPAILFVSRQAISKDVEIITPRYRSDAQLPTLLNLVDA